MKRVLLIVLGVVAGILALGVLAVFLLVKPDRIKEMALTKAREATGYSMEAGPASVQMGLAGAGIRVEAIELAAPDSSLVLAVEKVDVYLKLLPLLSRNVELRHVVLHQPRYSLRSTSPKGEARSPSGNAAPAVGFLAVESWEVKKGSYHQQGPWGELDLQGLDLQGRFLWSETEGGRGEAQGTMAGGWFDGPAGHWPFPGLDLDTEFVMSPERDTLSIPSLTLAQGPILVAVEGRYVREGSAWVGGLTGTMDPVSWSAVEALLPPDRREALDEVEIDGRISLPKFAVTQTEGESGTKVEGTLLFDDMAVKAPRAPLGLSNLGGEVVFSRDRMTLEKASGLLGDEPINLSGQVEGTDTKNARLAVETRVSGATLTRLLPEGNSLRLTGGSIALDLQAATPVPLSGVPRLTGTVQLEDLAGTFRELPLRETRGKIRLEGQGAVFEGMHTVLGRSDFSLDGTMETLAEPDLRFRLSSTLLDLDELMPPEPAEGEEKEEGKQGGVLALPGTGTVRIGELRVQGTRLQDVRARSRLGMDGLFLEDVSARAYGGTVDGNLQVVPAEASDSWRYSGTLEAKEVGVRNLVSDWTAVGDLLDGTLNATMDLSGVGGEDVDVLEALSLIGNLSITDGAFLNLPGLQDVGAALNVRGVSRDRWPFRKLITHFTVRDGGLVMTPLQIDQAGVAWTMAGRVGFDGQLSLDGTLRADPGIVELPRELQLLGQYVAEEDGQVPVDFRVGGGLSAPSVALDWDGLTQRAAEKAKREEAKKLEDQLKENLPENETVDKLKNLLGGKKKP